MTQDVKEVKIPADEILSAKFCGCSFVTVSFLAFEKYIGKSYKFVVNLVARVMNICRKKYFKCNKITVDDKKEAELYILKHSMKITEKMLEEGKLKSLGAVTNRDGLIILRGRAVEGLKMHYGTDEFPILTYDDPIAYLWLKKIHDEDHG